MNENNATNAIQTFVYKNEKPVRTVNIDGDVWFVAKDVADILGFEDATHAVRGLDDDEKGLHKMDTLGGMQDMTVISEPGLMTLILRSNKKEAKPFRRWVTHEVLPQIFRSGSYSMPNATQETAPAVYVPPQLPEKDKTDSLAYVSKGIFSFAEKIIEKTYSCKTEDDFRTVLALDNIFKNAHGMSALEAAHIFLTVQHDVDLLEETDSDKFTMYFTKHTYTRKWVYPKLPEIPKDDITPCEFPTD